MTTKRTPRRYWDENGRLEASYRKLWKALVPGSGNCETVEGEYLRAAGKIYYRYYNDGDEVDYGDEERNPCTQAHTFLREHGPRSAVLARILTTLEAERGKPYERALEQLIDFLIRWILTKKGSYTPNDQNLDYLA